MVSLLLCIKGKVINSLIDCCFQPYVSSREGGGGYLAIWVLSMPLTSHEEMTFLPQKISSSDVLNCYTESVNCRLQVCTLSTAKQGDNVLGSILLHMLLRLICLAFDLKCHCTNHWGIEFMWGGGVSQTPRKIFPGKNMETYQEISNSISEILKIPW